VVRKTSQAVISQSYSALKFCFEHTLQSSGTMRGFRGPSNARKLPGVLSREDVESIFSATKNLKHRAILMTIYSAGLRIGEATRLKVGDIDSKRMMIRVNEGKGLKDRYTLLGERNLELLRTYWKAYRPSDWLFPGNDSEPVSISSIQRYSVHLFGKQESGRRHRCTP